MRQLLRILFALLIIVVLALGGLTGVGMYTVRRMLPQHTGTLVLAGLDGKVEILRDANGIPHVYANTPRDLFFAQGVLHAQDRWWQMEFNRHTGLGRISELTGKNETSLNYDIFIRTLGWNRAAKINLEALSPDARTVLDNYAAGVNAYLAGKGGPDLAVEYSVLALRGINIPIEPWEPLHTVAWASAMAWNLAGNWSREYEIAAVFRRFGDAAEDKLNTLFPVYPYAENPPILTEREVAALPAAPGNAPARHQVRTQPLVAPGTDLSRVAMRLVGGLTPDTLGFLSQEPGIGSNNWVVGGSLTKSGKPLLANDPHLAIQMPSIWYQVGLHCVTVSQVCPYDVVGFSFPGSPGVIIGHNARIAWGVTNVEPDTQDLYIIKVDPTDDTKYELDGQMRDMQVLTESIKIGGQAEPFDLRVRLTRWGPIISETRVARDDSRGEERVLALRWSASEQPNRLIDAALAINRATDWDSFRAALRLWDAPSQNFVYADIDGNIGYQMPGRVTIRANGHSGLTPVDGSTSAYDWKGYLPFEYLPSVYNPQKGYIQTANQAVVPASYYEGLASVLGDQFGADSNYAFTLSWWSAGFRGKRINALIEANSQHTVESLGQIQGDNYNSLAAILLPAALSVLGSVPDVPASVTTWLGEWTDYQNDLSKGQPALFEAFWLELVKRLWGDDLGYTPDSSLLFLALDVLLDAPDHGWWDDSTTTTVRESRDDILKAAYAAAYKLVAQRLGTDDHTRWTWGALHTATFRSNPLGQSGIGPLESFVNGGPVAASGGTEIVNATRYRLSDPFVVRSVPSMRMVIDLSNLDASVWINATGQSGHPMSDQYRDQIERWRLIQFLPMRASRSAIEGATTSRLDLVPK